MLKVLLVILLSTLKLNFCETKYVEGHLKTLDVSTHYINCVVFKVRQNIYRIGHLWQDSVFFRVKVVTNIIWNSKESTVNQNYSCTLTIKHNGRQFISRIR